MYVIVAEISGGMEIWKQNCIKNGWSKITKLKPGFGSCNPTTLMELWKSCLKQCGGEILKLPPGFFISGGVHDKINTL